LISFYLEQLASLEPSFIVKEKDRAIVDPASGFFVGRELIPPFSAIAQETQPVASYLDIH